MTTRFEALLAEFPPDVPLDLKRLLATAYHCGWVDAINRCAEHVHPDTTPTQWLRQLQTEVLAPPPRIS